MSFQDTIPGQLDENIFWRLYQANQSVIVSIARWRWGKVGAISEVLVHLIDQAVMKFFMMILLRYFYFQVEVIISEKFK